MKSYLALLPIAAAVAIYVGRIIEVRTRRQTIRGPIRENLTLKLFVLAGTGMFVAGVAEYILRDWPWNWLDWADWLTLAAGVACAVASFSIRWRAIAALGKFWSLHVEIRENHEFVRSGPFRWMRHPTYFTMVLELLSLALILQAWWSFLVASLIFVPTLFYRVSLEERALVEKFGDTYREYQQTTPAVLPYKGPT